MKKLVFILVMLLSGCGSLPINQPTPKLAEPKLVICDGPCNYEILLEALEFWEDLAPGSFSTSAGVGVVTFIYAPDLVPPVDAETLSNSKICLVYLSDRATNWELYAHELGHCLGLYDVCDPDDLMYSTPNC